MENMDMSKMEILKQLTAVDFVIVDLHLYLNTHPADREALTKYNSLIMQSHMLKQNYERLYGPLIAWKSCSGYPWQWMNEPWPWEPEANFKI
jgi:spore coat protein JB